jgi:actin-like ATPase involved in cell morphogenesis
MRNEFYIDLGTANTLIYGKGRGFVLNEPSVLAFTESSSRRRSVFALGRSAKKMIGKTPPSISIVRPLKEGAIADFESTAEMLTIYIQRIRDQLFWFKPRLIISLPCRVTKFEKQANDDRISRAYDRMTDPEAMRRIRQEMMNMAMTHGEPLPDPYVSVRNAASTRADNRTHPADMPMNQLRMMLGLTNRPVPAPPPEPETTPENEFTA